MAKSTLKEELLDEPYRFEFFQAVRVLGKLFPDKGTVGGDAMPDQEVVRFRSRVAMDFPSSEVHEISRVVDNATGEERLEMFQNFMAMAGVSGVLPMHYTELVFSRLRYRDTAMWSFLDIFTHRAVSMFFRAWEKYRVPIGYERGDDSFTSYLFDLAGIGTTGLRHRMDLDDESLLPYTGLITQKPHSVNALENILSDYFSVPARVEQFFGQWLELSLSELTSLGRANNVLGRRTIAGSKIWDQQSKFRVRLGPLSFTRFLAFLPVGTAYKPLRSIVAFIAGSEYDFDVQLSLKKAQVPATILTTRAVRRPMLGWTSFLKSRPVKKDDEQLVLAFSSQTI
jgi:type VI secretion system protein ImpH